MANTPPIHVDQAIPSDDVAHQSLDFDFPKRNGVCQQGQLDIGAPPLTKADATVWIEANLPVSQTVRELAVAWRWSKSAVSRFLDEISGTQFKVTRDTTGTRIEQLPVEPRQDTE
jgi:hypothetical protein